MQEGLLRNDGGPSETLPEGRLRSEGMDPEARSLRTGAVDEI
jgi:hypothetical protein